MFKKITEMFSNAAAQPENTTHTASASLSADALHDLECRKRAIVADITRLAAELAACPDLSAPVGGLANLAVTNSSGGPYPRPATIAEAAEYFAARERV